MSYSKEEKLRLIELISNSGLAVKKACKQFGISSSSYYTWRNELSHELAQKQEKSPDDIGGENAREEAKEKLISLKQKHPYFGVLKLTKQLLRSYGLHITPSRAKKILEEHGFQTEKLPSAPSKGTRRFERLDPMELWMMDIMYYRLKKEGRFYLVSVLDDCSRYLLNWTVTTEPSTELVTELLKETFLIYGAPKVVKSDNGPEFRQKLAWFLEKRDIEFYPNPYHKPQYNGKTERQNKELRFAAERAASANTVEECISIIGYSFYEYNYIRPHQALGGVTPYQRYSGFEDDIKAKVKVFKEQEIQKKTEAS